VETEDQLGFLRRHRCEMIQGFLFSDAVPAAEIELLLRLQSNNGVRRQRRTS
jgi:EAL domain-containing protein (putative c-di-GMP-specific phosphodiesterase class I)